MSRQIGQRVVIGIPIAERNISSASHVHSWTPRGQIHTQGALLEASLQVHVGQRATQRGAAHVDLEIVGREERGLREVIGNLLMKALCPLIGDRDVGTIDRHWKGKSRRADMQKLEDGRFVAKGAVSAVHVAHDVPPLVGGRGMAFLIAWQVDQWRQGGDHGPARLRRSRGAARREERSKENGEQQQGERVMGCWRARLQA